MKARYSWYIALLIAFSSMTVLYTNCAGSHPDTVVDPNASNVEAESNVEVVKDFSGKLTANFQYVSTDGKAWGYALDSQDKTKALKVIFYSGGPVGTGTYAGEIIAKETGIGPNAGHYFNFKVPPGIANGQYQKLWAYGHEAKAENLIKPSPITFVSYLQKAEAYYNQNVAPFVNSQCIQCHSWTYQSLMYGPLLNPLPVTSGTATSNRFIRKMTGQDGHNGGVFCGGGANDGACAAIQAWWRAEFQ